MNKGTHFNGQPMYGQLINLLNKEEILKFSRENNGERYAKHFDAYQHIVVMLYAVIKRFDSLCEITDSMFPEARKLAHLGIKMLPRRSTLSDTNARRPESVFEATYRSLYVRYKEELSSDSRKRPVTSWLNRLQIIDSTTILLFSNLIFKGVGRHPKSGKKKGGINRHIPQKMGNRTAVQAIEAKLPLRYFYGESANAVKIQIWTTLIANLLLMVIQKRIKRSWSFSGLATMVRIMLMYYVNCYTFLEEPEKDWAKMIQEAKETPLEPSLFD